MTEFSDDFVYAYVAITLSRVVFLSFIIIYYYYYFLPRTYRIVWFSCRQFSLNQEEEEQTKMKEHYTHFCGFRIKDLFCHSSANLKEGNKEPKKKKKKV